MLNRTLRELMDEFLVRVYNGTAHPHRVSVLNEFVEWVEGYEKFAAECNKKIDNAFESAGLQRVTDKPKTLFGFPVVMTDAQKGQWAKLKLDDTDNAK